MLSLLINVLVSINTDSANNSDNDVLMINVGNGINVGNSINLVMYINVISVVVNVLIVIVVIYVFRVNGC